MAQVESMTRRELLERTGRVALTAGVLPFAGPLAELARAAPPGIYGQLARTLQGDVVVPGDPAYGQARVLFDTRFDGVHPHAVVFCESLTDVERTITWARRHGLRIAPRSGGHSYGGYSLSPGVVVDVSRLSRVALGPQRRAVVGAGARLIDVYAGLWEHGLTVPAGTSPTVGIAGLTLGGGIGFGARKFGLTCDNLVEATVVTASGRALVCNAHEHADLYWALRGGGGGNFGVVTRFVFRTHPVAGVATYALEWPWSDARPVVQAWQKWAPHAPDGLFSVCNLNCAGGGSPRITSAGQFFGTAQQLKTLIAPLTATGSPTRVSVVSRTYMDAARMWAGCSGTIAECHLQPQGALGRSTFKGKSDYANKLFSARAVDTLVRGIESRKTRGSGSAIVLLDSSGGAINRVPKGATAFVHRDALFSLQYLAYWQPTDPPAVGAANLRFLRNLYAAMRPFVSGFSYQNYIDPELSSWKHAYYGSNLARLVSVKRRHDPGNVFNFRQSIPTRL
ncbi:MAG: FAD-binding oxidoreductase [Actinobacteria bacterium]|nr:MAG: FAD-binding oxidoreductase [Actinomycetota bacterium]